MNLVFCFGHYDFTRYIRENNLSLKDVEPVFYHNMDKLRGRIFQWEVIHVTLDPLKMQDFVGKEGVRDICQHLSLLKQLCCPFHDKSIYDDYVFYVNNVFSGGY